MDWESDEFVDTTHLEDADRIEPRGDHSGGPPNRINDLSYSDWMKFQKSFFRYPGDGTTVAESIYFFTKERYDGRLSQTLLLGFDAVDPGVVETDREIDHDPIDSVADAVDTLEAVAEPYDFVLVDFRGVVDSAGALGRFLDEYVDDFWSALRGALRDERFAGVFVGLPRSDGAGYPLPWAVAGSCRDHVRLKDEKVALREDEGEVVYNLFVRAEDDVAEPTWVRPDEFAVADGAGDDAEIPPWTIPKPPARDEDEILHPAKYPETLIEEFIERFTDEGDAVFDPMVGTGSTVLAAIRNERDGYGVDLQERYVEIARGRVESEYRMTLTGEVRPQADGLIVQGDSTALDAVDELSGVTFDYAVTSPPYWSMLNNPGSENQKERRENDLPLKYSDEESDLGNIEAYDDFLETLESVYESVAERLEPGGHLTVVVKNVKRDHVIYPLAWDLAKRLCGEAGSYEYVGTTLWCQDDIGLKPFAVGTHWVSNTLHNYCLHFQAD